MYYFIYKTTNLIDNRYYIGMHKTNNINDGYLGSGKILKCAIKKYGRKNFKREILEYCNSDEEMHSAEAKYITKDVVNDKNSYNLKIGGEGGWDYVNNYYHSENTMKSARCQYNKLFENDDEFYKSWHDKVTKAKNIERWKQNMSKSLKERWKNYGHPWTGKHHKENTKKKIGSATSKAQRGSGNSQFGKVWISNTLIKKSISIKKEFLFDYLAEGWIKGRLYCANRRNSAK